MFTTLRSRLNVIYIGLILIGFGGLTALAGQQISATIVQDFGQSMQLRAILMGTELHELLEEDLALVPVYIDRNAENIPNSRISLFNSREEHVYSSDQTETTLATMSQDFIQQPNEQGVNTIFASAGIIEDGETIGYIQIAVPTSNVQPAINQRLLILGAGFLIFSLVGLAVTQRLVNSLTQPLSDLRDTALNMAQGDLTQRVTKLPEDEIGEVGKAFNQMAKQIEAMVAEQRAFASNASHELRTPLTTIRLRTEWLQSNPLDEDTTQQYIAEIDGEARHMSRLVEDLLLLSRLDAKRLEVGDERIDVSRLGTLLQRRFGDLAEAKGVDLVMEDAPAGAIPPIQANPNHLQMVLGNVINNGVKYTPAGGQVSYSVQVEGGFVVWRVRDTGRGIAPADLPHIGKRFYRADRARSRQIMGTGLGLALAHSIVNLYGGHLDIASDGQDKGTSVTIKWPIEQ